MGNAEKLAKNTVVLSIGVLFSKLVSIITIPLLTAGLSTSEYGTYDLITTLVSLLLPIATLQIQSAAFRFLIDCRGDKKKSSEIVTNIFVVTVPVSLVALTILFFVLSELSITIRLLICAYYLLDILFLAIQQITRGLSHNLYYSISAIIVSLINLITIVVFISGLSMGLIGVLVSLVISYFIALVFLCIKIGRELEISSKYFSLKCVKSMLAYSWPMVPNNLSTWVLSLSDRLVITMVLGVEFNAVYAVANKIPNMMSSLQSIFTMAWQENASIAKKEDDVSLYYTQMFDTIYCFLCGVIALTISFTPLLFLILIKGEYDAAYYQMPILFMGVLFGGMSSFLSGIYVAFMKTKNIGASTIVAAALNLTVDLFFVNRIGITAGSLSTLISYLFLFVLRMRGAKKIAGIEYNYVKVICMALLISIMCLLCYARKTTTNIINLFIGTCFALYFNRKLIKALYIKLKENINNRRVK